MNKFTELTSLSSVQEASLLIGMKARERRKSLKLSRKELSQKSGVSVPTISRFELSGTATLKVIIKIAIALSAIETLNGVFKPSQYQTLDEFFEAKGSK